MQGFFRRFSSARKASAAPASVLFLDVDGVLNTQQTRVTSQLPAPAQLAELARIIASTRAALVLSSTWRLDESTLADIECSLAGVGLRLIGSTPQVKRSRPHKAGERCDEILAWLSSTDLKVCAWVALDDMDLLGSPKCRIDPEHFVQTSDEDGLTRSLADEVILSLEQQT